MINLTLDVIFKKEGAELEKAVIRAVKETRKVLFENFSEGKIIPDTEIVSTTKRENLTHTLAFCKFFKEDNIQNIDASHEEFIRSCLEINRASPNKLSKKDFSRIIPDFENNQSKLSATFITEIKRALGVVLMSLWHQQAIILPPNFKMPGTRDGRGGKRKIICKPFFSEVLDFFESFRISSLSYCERQRLTGLGEIAQKNLQHYVWRLILSTDWHRVEDLCVEEIALFQRQVKRHKDGGEIFVNMAVPVRTMLDLLIDEFGERVSFTQTSYLEALVKVDGAPSKDAKYTPTALLQGPWYEDVVGFDLEKASKEWARTQVAYVNGRKKSGMKAFGDYVTSLTKLNEYLFFVLPQHLACSDFQEEFELAEPRHFTRKYLDGNEEIPSFIEHLQSGLLVNVSNAHLGRIDAYFDYLEALSTSSSALKGFKNPIHRTIDFKRSRRRKGTAKSIVSRLHFTPMLHYYYAIEQFIAYVLDTLLSEDSDCENEQILIEESREKIGKAIEAIPFPYDTWVDTKEFGYIPFIAYRGKTYPIHRIHKSVFAFSNRKSKSHGRLKLPNPIHIYFSIVAFETGIRGLHIKWLDMRTYDKDIDRNKPLSAICKLNVNTDKVKKEAWTSYVSRRVIQVLDKLKSFNLKMDEAWAGHTYWYDGHVESDFGKIDPLFKTGGNTVSSGKPASDMPFLEGFRKILKGFEVFANENELFDEPLDFVQIVEGLDSRRGGRYRTFQSELTPHGARSTLISHNVHVLPHWAIGKYLTGQESEAVVAYYAVIDEQYMKVVGHSQEVALRGSHALLDDPSNPIAIKADGINSKLRQAVNDRMEDAFATFGAMSFDRDSSNGKIESGMIIAKELGAGQIAYNSTHMCPYNNHCPKEIVEEIGERQCGQCWASIKTVDHLPRISAHIRDLHAKVEEKTSSIEFMIVNGASDKTIEMHDLVRTKLAAEESAWIATHAILESFRQDLAKRDHYLVAKPEIVEKQLTLVATDGSPLTNILLRIRDAQDYPEYMTPQLNASITKLRNMILAKAGDIDKLVNQPDNYELLDEFRGIIRSICDATGASVEDLSKQMRKELPVGNKALLEAF